MLCILPRHGAENSRHCLKSLSWGGEEGDSPEVESGGMSVNRSDLSSGGQSFPGGSSGSLGMHSFQS